ncbi:MAG: CHRD domain-containing protein [Sedimentisphaerales bacterium]|nr:CHRD domain-containing protein [Sedimentisphaerales bacterium]
MTARNILKRSCLAGLLLLFRGAVPTASGQYGGGSGTSDDPYLIATAEQLAQIGQHPADWDAHFAMIADIDLGGMAESTFKRIGTDLDAAFCGVFDGNGFCITNLSLSQDQKDYVGLFGVIGDPQDDRDGIVRNLGLVDVAISAGDGVATGALAGYLAQGLIENCFVRNGTVRNHSHFVGGLVGAASAPVQASYADVRVIGVFEAGGLVGLLEENGLVQDCYALGRVSAVRYAGGCIGDLRNGARVENAYATGRIDADLDYGGLVGINSGEIAACFWDYQQSGILYMCGAEEDGTGCTGEGGKTTPQMRQQETFTAADWDFTTPVWKIEDGYASPRLAWEIQNPATFLFTLDADQLPEPIATTAFATGIVRLDGQAGRVSWDILTSGLNQDPNSTIIAAGFYGPAEPNQTAPLQLDLLAHSSGPEDLASTAPVELTTSQLEQLQAGRWYIQIASSAHPGGVLRGQVVKRHDIHPDKITVKADQDRSSPSDSIRIDGRLYPSSDDARPEDLIYADELLIRLVNLDEADAELDEILRHVIPIDELPISYERTGLYSYKRRDPAEGPLQRASIDFAKNAFSLQAAQADLSGLRLPFGLSVSYGPYRGAVVLAESNRYLVNRGKPLPLILLNDRRDALRVDKAKVRSSSQGDSLKVQGAIAAADPNGDWSQETLTIHWGDYQVALPAGNLLAAKDRLWKYTRPKQSPDPIAKVLLDLGKCKFAIQLSQASPLADESPVLFQITSEHFAAQDLVEW